MNLHLFSRPTPLFWPYRGDRVGIFTVLPTAEVLHGHRRPLLTHHIVMSLIVIVEPVDPASFVGKEGIDRIAWIPGLLALKWHPIITSTEQESTND